MLSNNVTENLNTTRHVFARPLPVQSYQTILVLGRNQDNKKSTIVRLGKVSCPLHLLLRRPQLAPSSSLVLKIARPFRPPADVVAVGMQQPTQLSGALVLLGLKLFPARNNHLHTIWVSSLESP